MGISQAILMGILSIGLLGFPLASETQPALEQFRFNPPQLCFRETFRWAFSYRGLPGRLQFDRPSDGPPRYYPREQNASRCFWEERPEGQLVNRDTGQPFRLDDSCVFRGGTMGPDPGAYRSALQAVQSLVGTEPRSNP